MGYTKEALMDVKKSFEESINHYLTRINRNDFENTEFRNSIIELETKIQDIDMSLKKLEE